MMRKTQENRIENREWRTGIPHSPFPIPHSIQKGFTLIETMVAIAILLIAVVSPISLIGNSLHNLYYARDQVVAVNLAQEGIEVVRKKRDSNLLAAGAWGTGFAAGKYVVDAPSLSLTASADTKVYQDKVTKFYGQGAVKEATPFSRTVDITDISTTEKRVISTVTWLTGNQQGTIAVTEYLFNWMLPGGGAPPVGSYPAVKSIFVYKGFNQDYLVPTGVNTLRIKAWGAGAAGANQTNTANDLPGGGAGGYGYAEISVTEGELLTVVVGQGGSTGWPPPATFGGGGAGAVNSGDGAAGTGGGGGGGSGFGGLASSGGGASGVMRAATWLVRGGGGGGGGYYLSNQAGGGGGTASGAGGVYKGGSSSGGAGGASIGTITTNGQAGNPGALSTAGNSTDADWSNYGTGGANTYNGGPAGLNGGVIIY